MLLSEIMLSLFVMSTTVNHRGSAFISANLQAMVIQNTYYYYYGISFLQCAPSTMIFLPLI